MLRRILVTVLPLSFLFAMFAPPAHAGVIERVETDAQGLLPATVIVTLRDPSTETQLVRVCLTSRSAGQLLCVAI